MGKKNLCVTYFLWLVFGLFGGHHFYLGRDRHGFVWWSTFGGFLLGWIRDLWRIPTYVQDANEDEKYMASLTALMRDFKRPPFKLVRFMGQVVIGNSFGSLVRIALPEELSTVWSDLLVCIAITIGVHTIGNIGREQSSFMTPFVVTLLSNFITRFYLIDNNSRLLVCSFLCSSVLSMCREHKRVYKKREFMKRFAVVTSSMLLIMNLWLGFLYFNAEITTEDGETIKVRDSVHNFFKSPAWVEFSDTMKEIYNHAQVHGWGNLYNEFVKALDPKGESNARKVLGIDANTPPEEIKKLYKKLVRKWHPDRHKGASKEEAQRKFMEIQQAYDALMSKKSATSREDDKRTEF